MRQFKDMDTPIAKLFKAGRERADLSQQALGDLIGLSDTFVFKVEGGRSIPHPKHAPKIAKALGLQEQAVNEAIMASKYPGLKAVPPPAKHGYFVEFSVLEERQVAQFARARGWASAEALIRRVVLDFLDAKK